MKHFKHHNKFLFPFSLIRSDGKERSIKEEKSSKEEKKEESKKEKSSKEGKSHKSHHKDKDVKGHKEDKGHKGEEKLSKGEKVKDHKLGKGHRKEEKERRDNTNEEDTIQVERSEVKGLKDRMARSWSVASNSSQDSAASSSWKASPGTEFDRGKVV